MNIADAAAVYAGATEGQAVYYGPHLLWNVAGWEPPAATLLNNLLAFYPLNDAGNGTVSLLDTSGNNRTLTNNNGVLLHSGRILGGANFDSSQKSLTRNDFVFFGLSNLTFSFWLFVNGVSSPQCFLHTGTLGQNNGGGIGFYGDSSNKILCLPFNNSALGLKTENFERQKWYHIVATFARTGSTTEAALYVDGAFVGSKSGSPWFTSSSQNGLVVGRATQQQSNNGIVDAVGIWDRALTQAEIVQLYNSGSGFEFY
jgi:hypothetical protein